MWAVHSQSPTAPGIAYQPRTLLALLTYAYALGIYASSDVEAMMRADNNFRHLCAGEFPHWKVLRHFRRAKSTLSEQMAACRARPADREILRTPAQRIIEEAVALPPMAL